jgi:REP-associated tyrosine transposase
MKYDPDRHHRRSLRLKNFDYAQDGLYFITICIHRRQCLLGSAIDGGVRLNRHGEIAEMCWRAIPRHFPHAVLDEFVIMPNHIHGIIAVGARHTVPLHTGVENFGKPVGGSIPTIVRSFKSAVSKLINEHHRTPGVPVWQRNYYEHVIRDEKSLDRLREYIVNNPLRWSFDPENPAAMDHELNLPNDAESCLATNSIW